MPPDYNPKLDAAGLTSSYISCDRSAVRYPVAPDVPRIARWTSARLGMPLALLADLERFGAPERWWVSRRPVAVDPMLVEVRP